MNQSAVELRSALIQLTNEPLHLVINKNRCTYIKVLFKKPISASVHEAFLEAPEKIIRSLASYIKGNLCEEETLYAYMQNYYQTHEIEKIVCPQGTTYDLNLLYNRINSDFFDDALSLSATWWQNSPKPGARQCTLGVFLDTLQLIKIHSLLDSPRVPQYVVESVLFHEMLHAVVPTEKDARGRTLVHTKKFQKRVQEFPDSERADQWLKKNRSHFFTKKMV